MGVGTDYGDYTEEAAKRNNVDGKFFKIQDGENLIRVLPPIPGETVPYLETRKHFLKLEDGTFKSFDCLRAAGKPYCPACKAFFHFNGEDKESKDKAGNFRGSRKYYANVIDRNNEEKGVQLVQLPVAVEEALRGMRTHARKPINYCHPEEGCDVSITKSGKGFSTKYTAERDEVCALGSKEEMDEWLDNRYVLTEQFYTPDISNIEQWVNSVCLRLGEEPLFDVPDEPTDSYDSLDDMDLED